MLAHNSTVELAVWGTGAFEFKLDVPRPFGGLKGAL
jgi:hypothetical protein